MRKQKKPSWRRRLLEKKPHDVIELIDLLMADSSEEKNEGSARAETDPYMQSKCLNKVRRPETDPYM